MAQEAHAQDDQYQQRQPSVERVFAIYERKVNFLQRENVGLEALNGDLEAENASLLEELKEARQTVEALQNPKGASDGNA